MVSYTRSCRNEALDVMNQASQLSLLYGIYKYTSYYWRADSPEYLWMKTKHDVKGMGIVFTFYKQLFEIITATINFRD